jgi:hypothetical protein
MVLRQLSPGAQHASNLRMAAPFHVGHNRGSRTFVVVVVLAALLLIGVILWVQRQPAIPSPPPPVTGQPQR